MQNLEMTYESRGTRNFLSVKTENPLSDFKLRMVENNEIPGLLPLKSRALNNQLFLDFEISGQKRIKDMLDEGSIKGDVAKKFLQQIIKAFLEVENYMLQPEQCILDIDYMFMSPEGELSLVYMPCLETLFSTPQNVKEFFQGLLAEYLTAENDPLFFTLLRYVNQRDFTVSGLVSLIQESTSQKEEKNSKPDAKPLEEKEPQALDYSQPQVVETPEHVETKESKIHSFGKKQDNHAIEKDTSASVTGGFAIPGGNNNFAIPGLTNSPASAKDKKENDKDVKSIISGLFNKKEKDNAVEKQTTPKQGFGFGNKNSDSKPSFSVPGKKAEPVASKPVNNPAPINSKAQSNPQGEWHGTVMMPKHSEANATRILGSMATPVLQYKGNKIMLDQFPFRLGREDSDYNFGLKVISHSHATIILKGGQYYIKDENSTNHTYVNGKIIPTFTETNIKSGDVIRLANEEMTFVLEG